MRSEYYNLYNKLGGYEKLEIYNQNTFLLNLTVKCLTYYPIKTEIRKWSFSLISMSAQGVKFQLFAKNQNLSCSVYFH